LSKKENEIVESPPSGRMNLMPVVSPEDAKMAYNAYLQLCQSILIPYDKRIVKDGVVVQESDYSRIAQKKKVGNKWVTEFIDAPKKSAFRKLAKFYGVSTEILEKSSETHKDKSYTWHFTVKAWQGAVQTTGEGSCTNNEKGRERTIHDTKATAHTRAKSRAISDLIGFGQVSAEEIEEGEEQKESRRQVEAQYEQVSEVTEESTEPETPEESQEELENKMTLNPEVEDTEDRVRKLFEVNNLDISDFNIYLYGSEVVVKPPKDIDMEVWGDYNTVMEREKAPWDQKAHQWTVPVDGDT